MHETRGDSYIIYNFMIIYTHTHIYIYIYKYIYTRSLKLTASLPLKINGWFRWFISFWNGLFSGELAVSFREGIYIYWIYLTPPPRILVANKGFFRDPLLILLVTISRKGDNPTHITYTYTVHLLYIYNIYIYIWVFPKNIGFYPPKSSIKKIVGFPLFSPSILEEKNPPIFGNIHIFIRQSKMPEMFLPEIVCFFHL